MAFPKVTEEIALHQRVLAGDPVAPVDVFKTLMDPLVSALRRNLRCTQDEAYDSCVDAVLAYLEQPRHLDPAQGRLSTFVAAIAKKRAIDRLRSRTSGTRREITFAKAVELRRPNPKDTLDAEVEAHDLWQRVEQIVPDERDRRVLRLVLGGERSTAVLAKALDITEMPAPEQRREVKRHRDRLMKVLERLGMRLRDDDDT